MADCPLFRADPVGPLAHLTTNIHLLPEREFYALIAKKFVKTDKQTHKLITVNICTTLELPQFRIKVGDYKTGPPLEKRWNSPDGQQKSIKPPNHALVDPRETSDEIRRLVDTDHAFNWALKGEGPLKLVAEILPTALKEKGYKEILVRLRRYVLLALMKTGTAERTDAGHTDPIIHEPGHRLHLKAPISRMLQQQFDILLSWHLVAAQSTLEASMFKLLAEPNQYNWEACFLVLLALCQLHEINYEDCKRRAQENSVEVFSNPPWLWEAAHGLLRLLGKLKDSRAKLPHPDKAVQLCLLSIQDVCIPKTFAPVMHTLDWFLKQSGVAQGNGDLAVSV